MYIRKGEYQRLLKFDNKLELYNNKTVNDCAYNSALQIL